MGKTIDQLTQNPTPALTDQIEIDDGAGNSYKETISQALGTGSGLPPTSLDITYTGSLPSDIPFMQVAPWWGYVKAPISGDQTIYAGVGVGVYGPVTLTDSQSLLTTLSYNNLGAILAQGSLSVTSMNALTTLAFPKLTSISGDTQVSALTALTTLNLSALISVTGRVFIESNTALTTLDLSALISAYGGVIVTSNTALTTLDLSALTSAYGGVSIESNTALTSVLVPNFLPTDGTSLAFDTNALDDTSVNLVLARCVAAGVTTCTIYLNGGTNSAPTGQGIINAAALVVAGNTVTTN